MQVGMQTRVQPRLGMRYGPSGVWYLKPGSLFLETGNRTIKATVKKAGVTPKIPSLQAAVEGVYRCYEALPVMGTDPEFFLEKDGDIVPAFDWLPDKHSTLDGLFWDGFQAETTVDPFQSSHIPQCHQTLGRNIARQLEKLGEKNLNIAAQSVWRIPSLMLQYASEAHVALGCDPSRNVYGTHGRTVLEPRKLNWRFAGGHLHFALDGVERNDPDNIRYLVKTLDAALGIPSVCLAQNYDHFIRRRYYGLAGEYRLPPHGLEYRTLSNFWLPAPEAFMLVFDLGRHALNLGRARLKNVLVGSERSIQQTIDFCDVRSAKDFMRLNKEFYTAWANLMYGNSKTFWEAINAGVDKVIPQFGKDVVYAWRNASEDWKQVPKWADL